ncbi:hypothetical protein JCM14036_02750 [Desulfotomaculum defluvii]
MNKMVIIVPGLPMDYKVLIDVVLISPLCADKIINEEVEKPVRLVGGE